MKSSTAIIFGLIASIFAAPVPMESESVTIQLINDITGANGAAIIPTDNTAANVIDHFFDTPIETQDPRTGQKQFLASSAQLVKFSENVSCDMAINNEQFGLLSSQKTFVNLGSVRELKQAIIRCHVT
jgi:hypothetical protein